MWFVSFIVWFGYLNSVVWLPLVWFGCFLVWFDCFIVWFDCFIVWFGCFLMPGLVPLV